jgi:uncharacterized phage protein (TIGR01671 family)
MENLRFKFRVWDKRIKKMITSSNYQNFEDEIEEYNEKKGEGRYNGFYAYITGERYPMGSFDCLDFYDDIVDSDNKDYLIFMQSTGLKDKNGKLIYEGDICNNAKGSIFYIEYDKKTSSYLAKFIKNKDSLFGEMESFFLCMTNQENLEILGNIYENPELLTKKDSK